MDDLLIAKTCRDEKKLAFVIVKEGEVIFSSKESGVKSIIKAIDELGGELRESAVADKVVGRAAAMLWTYANVDSLYAEVISEPALEFLNDTALVLDYGETTPAILNREKTGSCPFEKMAETILKPEAAYKTIKDFLEKSHR